MKTVIVVALLILPVPLLAQMFKPGDTVMVVPTTDCVNVRSIPSVSGSVVLKCEPANTRGVINSGPVVSAPFTFWNLTYSDGLTGWSAELYLVKVNTPPPPPPFPVTARDSVMFNLGVASAGGIDSLMIVTRGFRTLKVVNDSTIVAKP